MHFAQWSAGFLFFSISIILPALEFNAASEKLLSLSMETSESKAKDLTSALLAILAKLGIHSFEITSGEPIHSLLTRLLAEINECFAIATSSSVSSDETKEVVKFDVTTFPLGFGTGGINADYTSTALPFYSIFII